MTMYQQHAHKRELYPADISAKRQRESVAAGNSPIIVYGLDKIGLPPATALTGVIRNDTDIDSSRTVFKTIWSGAGPVDREPQGDEEVAPFPITSLLTDSGTETDAVDQLCTELSEPDTTPSSSDRLSIQSVGGIVLVAANEEFDWVEWNKDDSSDSIDGSQAIDTDHAPQPVYTPESASSATDSARIQVRDNE